MKKTRTTPPRETKSKTKVRRFAAKRAAPYLRKMSVAVRGHFAEATNLSTFLAGAGQLTPQQRKLIVRQALILIEQNYAHLPLKRPMHSIDPVQRLKLLLQTLETAPDAGQPGEAEFHAELTDVFTSLRDLHTNYLLPAPFNAMSAFLPFIVEDFFEAGGRKYIVSHIVPGFSHPTFVAGVEITHWNGMPIERAVWSNAQRYAGSNREARHARGVETLTTRALRIAPPPDELWVVVGYRTSAGQAAELRFDWQVNPPLPTSMDEEAAANPAAAASLGLDLEQDIIRRTRLALFAPQVVAVRKKAREKTARGGSFGDLESHFPGIFTAREVNTPAGTFGFLRVRTFSHWPPEEFVAEFLRLTANLPQNGLIIDVRGNGGGVIMNGELILQTLTARRIEPEPLQFVNTPLNCEICRRNGPASPWTDLSAWVESMEQALRTGAVFSAGFPISDPEQCNAIGQKYFGPVVAIIDGLCYSTTDIFAAGFQDHEIGPVLGTDGNTGAGGANVWEHGHLVNYVLPGSVYQALPNGAGMRVSMRRTLRVGRRAGAPLEDLGVVPSHRHFLTRNDLLNGNEDLINAAGALLAAQPVRALKVTIQSAAAQSTITAETRGMTRLDIYTDGRPRESLEIQGDQATFNLAAAGSGLILEIRGFADTQLVARYRTKLG